MPDSAVSALPGDIAAWLQAQDVLSNVQILTAFPAAAKPVPLTGPICAVGLAAAVITDKFVANDDGVLEEQEYCRTAALKLSFSIHVPYSSGGDACHTIWTTVTDLLTFASDLNITSSGCGQVAARRDTDSFVLEAYINVTADFCPAESTGLTLASFLPKDLLCGSHISNTAIHLSAEEKTWLDAPAVTGSYIGDGTSSQSVTLSAAPKYVRVWALEYPETMPDFTAGTCKVYAGSAAADGGTLGLELTADGFRLRSGSAYTLGSVAAALNESGLSYGYFAVNA